MASKPPIGLHVVADSSGAIICQVFFLRRYLLAPLHAFDLKELKFPSQIALAGSPWAHRIKSLQSVARVPAADLAIYSFLGPQLNSQSELFVAEEIVRGAELDIHWIESQADGQYRTRTRPTTARDLIEIDRYQYSTSSGRHETLASVRAVILSLRASLGMSGAPVFLAHRPEVLVGFIHGNAPQNGGEALVLDCSMALEQLGLVKRFQEPLKNTTSS